MNINVFLLFCSFVFLQIERERERERVYKIWYKEKQSQSYLSYFSTGFHWRIFLLLRANRLYAIFNTGLKNLGLSCLQIFFCLLHPEYLAFGSVSYEPCQTTNLFFSFFSLTGRRCHFRFRVPANRLASTFLPPWSGDFVRATRCHPSQVTEYRQVAPIYPHALTVILWGLALLIQTRG